VIGADDWDVFLSSEDFATLAAWETLEGETAELEGIFQDAHEVVLSGDTIGASTVMPALTVATSQLPTTAAEGDDLEIRGINYRVADLQPDGSGMTRVILERG